MAIRKRKKIVINEREKKYLLAETIRKRHKEKGENG